MSTNEHNQDIGPNLPDPVNYAWNDEYSTFAINLINIHEHNLHIPNFHTPFFTFRPSPQKGRV